MEIKDWAYVAGIILTALLGGWNARNHFKTNKKTSFINTVTSERIKWLDKLRKNISDFCGLTHTWTRSIAQDEEKVKMLGEIDKLRYLIRLQLNPKIENKKPNVDKEIEDLITRIPELTGESFLQELDDAMNDLVEKGQILLKNEWEKVKSEAKVGDLKDA